MSNIRDISGRFYFEERRTRMGYIAATGINILQKH